MKRTLALLMLLVGPLAFAQDVLNATRPDTIVSTGSQGGGAMPIVQLVFAMLIVGGLLKFALPKLLPNLKNKFQSSVGSSIVIEETASFTGGQILVVKARGRTFLLGSTTTQLSLLSELTEDATANEPVFFELVDKADGKLPTHAVIAEDIPTPVKANVGATASDQLARLKRLIG